MMLRTCIAAAVLALLIAPHRGHAAIEANFAAKTTGDIVALCDPQSTSALDTAGINFCDGFAQGAVLVEQQHEAAPHAHQYFCLPDPAPSRNESIAAFVKWARATPSRLDMSAVDGFMTFLGDQYPCAKHR